MLGGGGGGLQWTNVLSRWSSTALLSNVMSQKVDTSICLEVVIKYMSIILLQVMASAIEVLNHCDKLSSCTPLVKWTEPVHVAVSSVHESCLLFITNNFFSLIDERSFHEILKVNFVFFTLICKMLAGILSLLIFSWYFLPFQSIRLSFYF